jgi:hypothetical protein
MAKLWRLPPVGFANDIETGAFEVGDDSLSAAKQLLKRYPYIASVFAPLRHRHDGWNCEH